MRETVVPDEIAKALGVSGPTFRAWLRTERDAGHPLLERHLHRQRYRFSRDDSDQLMAEYRAAEGRARTPGQRYRGTANRPDPLTRRGAPLPGPPLSDDPGHRVTERSMGADVTTLADLLQPGLRAVVVGINPSPASVGAGHYYQGRSGQRFLGRLVQAGVLTLSGDAYEDDQAHTQGIGFTDAVKRPTARADGLRPGELAHGRHLLEQRLAAVSTPRVIFTFKKAAVALLGGFEGHGRLRDRALGGAEVFVMPGPMERADRVERALRDLAEWWLGEQS